MNTLTEKGQGLVALAFFAALVIIGILVFSPDTLINLFSNNPDAFRQCAGLVC